MKSKSLKKDTTMDAEEMGTLMILAMTIGVICFAVWFVITVQADRAEWREIHEIELTCNGDKFSITGNYRTLREEIAIQCGYEILEMQCGKNRIVFDPERKNLGYIVATCSTR